MVYIIYLAGFNIFYIIFNVEFSLFYKAVEKKQVDDTDKELRTNIDCPSDNTVWKDSRYTKVGVGTWSKHRGNCHHQQREDKNQTIIEVYGKFLS